MWEDEEGFHYPQVELSKCIECRRCEKVCTFKKDIFYSSNADKPIETYAARHVNQKVLMTSTSGGMFTALSDFIIEKSGSVFGAEFDEDFCISHKRATTKFERNRFKGSKYVQSNLKKTFTEIKQDIIDGKDVMFSGTPCQNAALRNYLGNIDISKLLLCDIICHGVTSPMIWRDYKNRLEKKFKSKLKFYDFRPKYAGWEKTSDEVCMFENGKTVHTIGTSYNYKKMYYGHLITRPSCHNCPFTSLRRVSDITIADCRGIEKVIPEIKTYEGVSLVMINSDKGRSWFQNVKDTLEYYPVPIESLMQPQLIEPGKASPHRTAFWEHYYQKGLNFALNKHFGLIYGLKNKLKRLRTLLSAINK